MSRPPPHDTTQIRSVLAFVALAALLTACISNKVSVDASDGHELMRAATLHVSLAGDAKAETGTAAISPVAQAELRARTENALRAKGYAIGSVSESDLILELTPRTESAPRRTWSSDPDASGVRIVRKPEAVLSLRARSRGASAEVWRCEARARLPEPGRRSTTNVDEVWSQLLAKALEQVPDRR